MLSNLFSLEFLFQLSDYLRADMLPPLCLFAVHHVLRADNVVSIVCIFDELIADIPYG